MTISFKYKKVKRKDGVERKLPFIPIEMQGNSIWIEVASLLDSGADVSVIPKDLAELLNLDLTGEKTKANGIGGEITVINSKMNIRIKNAHERYEFEIPVQVILEETKAPPIIGREGFFDKFIIEFNHFNERIKLKSITHLERDSKIYTSYSRDAK